MGRRSLKDFVTDYTCQHISSDYLVWFGNNKDGVIEIICSASNPERLFETGYYYGETKPKPIINISTMIGCPAKCIFCELGKYEFVRNLTADEMYEQVVMMLQQASRFVSIDYQHKVNLAKSGEPLLNPELVSGLQRIGAFGFSFKVSTVFPRGKIADRVFRELTQFASEYNEPVQLQISLISTSEDYRKYASGGLATNLGQTRERIEQWITANPAPKGRKPNVSLILSKDTPANPRDIMDILPPHLVNIRLRDYVPTYRGIQSHLLTIEKEHLTQLKAEFMDCGYAVSYWASPTTTEQRFRLSSNSTLERYRQQIGL